MKYKKIDWLDGLLDKKNYILVSFKITNFNSKKIIYDVI